MTHRRFVVKARSLSRLVVPAGVAIVGAVGVPVLAAAPAFADTTTTQCVPLGGPTQPLAAQVVVPLTFNQFDPSVGTLTGVQVTVSGNFTFTLTGTATSTRAKNAQTDLAVVWGPGFTAQSSGSFVPDPPALTGTNVAPAIPSGDVGVSAVTPINLDTVIGPVNDVNTFTGLTGTGTASSTDGYSGTGTVVLDAESDGSLAAAGINPVTGAPTQVTAQVCVAYSYTAGPPPQTPESPLAALLPLSAVAIGAGGFVMLRRRPQRNSQ